MSSRYIAAFYRSPSWFRAKSRTERRTLIVRQPLRRKGYAQGVDHGSYVNHFLDDGSSDGRKITRSRAMRIC
jgi:hypothetical protein